ncbi:MAG: hypothetical protein IKX67_07300 [Bacteroidales bacterium]|nr:hypothetical protein [Bacteroidales bacterium]
MNGELKLLIGLLAVILFWAGCVALTLWVAKGEEPDEPMTQEQQEVETMLILMLAPILAAAIVFSWFAQLFGRIFRRKSDEG